MPTQDDLVREVLEKLNAIGANDDPSAEETQKVKRQIAAQSARLNRLDIVYIQDLDNIEDEYFDPFAVIVAVGCATAFGQAPDYGARADAEAMLIAMQPPKTGVVVYSFDPAIPRGRKYHS